MAVVAGKGRTGAAGLGAGGGDGAARAVLGALAGVGRGGAMAGSSDGAGSAVGRGRGARTWADGAGGVPLAAPEETTTGAGDISLTTATTPIVPPMSVAATIDSHTFRDGPWCGTEAVNGADVIPAAVMDAVAAKAALAVVSPVSRVPSGMRRGLMPAAWASASPSSVAVG